MKFKVIAVIAVVVVMLLATLLYMATKSNSGIEGEPQTEEVQSQ